MKAQGEGKVKATEEKENACRGREGQAEKAGRVGGRQERREGRGQMG